MRIQRSAAAFAALMFAATPATAIDIVPSLLLVSTNETRLPGTPLIEFDPDEWAVFIGSAAPDYQLSRLGTGIDALDGTTAVRHPLTVDVADERLLSQVWERR